MSHSASGGGASPFRISFRPICAVDGATLDAHVAASARYPLAEEAKSHGRRLAIVGGGPSVAKCLDELRAFDGDVWAINHTAAWLARHGVESTLVSIDGLPLVGAGEGVERALLASCCHPVTFAQCASVRRFHLIEHAPDGIPGGTTTACRLPFLALRLGYANVIFFGCEGSFAETDHVDRDDAPEAQLIVRAAGQDYRTSPQMLMQCQDIAQILTAFPQVFTERCGGLLRAMTADTGWSIVAVSAALKRHLEAVNGCHGLYGSRYEVAA